MKYRKKPLEVEAIQWNGNNFDEIMNFVGDFHGNKVAYENAEELAYSTGEITIRTLEDGADGRAKHVASKGDWIIQGVQGKFYPCKPDIFEETYEKVEE